MFKFCLFDVKCKLQRVSDDDKRNIGYSLKKYGSLANYYVDPLAIGQGPHFEKHWHKPCEFNGVDL